MTSCDGTAPIAILVGSFRHGFSGHKVTYTAASPAMVAQKLAAREALDVVVQSAPAMAELEKVNGLKPETRKPAARGGVGVAVHPDATPPDISTADAFKKTLLDAKSIGVGDPAVAGWQRRCHPRPHPASWAGWPKVARRCAKGEIEPGLMTASEVHTFAGPVPVPLKD